MLNYDDGVPFAVVAAYLYTEAFCLATGGPLDPEADVPATCPASQLPPLVHLRVTTAFGG
jgi:hypothetical protein